MPGADSSNPPSPSGGSGSCEFTKTISSPSGVTATPPYAAVPSTSAEVSSVPRSSTPMSSGLTSFAPDTYASDSLSAPHEKLLTQSAGSGVVTVPRRDPAT